MKVLFACVAAATAVAAPSARAQATSTSKPMSFEACLAVIDRVSRDLRIAPIGIVNTKIMRVVRFPTTEGSVLITCSKPDRKMIVTRSGRR